MNRRNAEYWIQGLGLNPHPEGGHYLETYRSTAEVGECCSNHSGRRPMATAIYYLLQGRDFSAFHRIHSDEVWHHYSGSPMTLHLLKDGGTYEKMHLGPELSRSRPQVLIPAQTWFAATGDDFESYSLVGCTVAPGFDFADFELGNRTELIAQFPKHCELIGKLTR